MVTAAEVLIHFLGICLWANEVPNDCGQKIILPQIVYRDPGAAVDRIAVPTAHHIGEPVAAPLHTQRRHIEDHVAVLIFPQSIYDTNVNWAKPTPLPSDPGYGYVKLDGERVRFLTGLPDQALKTGELYLPGLTGLCPTMGSLKAEYQPPYSGAAAVIDLPQGEAYACHTSVRVDSEVRLFASNIFTISASTMRARKEIRLKTDVMVPTELIVANVPVSCLSAEGCKKVEATSLAGVPHSRAYFEMATNVCDASLSDWTIPATSDQKVMCKVHFPYLGPGAGDLRIGHFAPRTNIPPSGGGTDPGEMANFECSNAKYP